MMPIKVGLKLLINSVKQWLKMDILGNEYKDKLKTMSQDDASSILYITICSSRGAISSDTLKRKDV
jgi:hypothetical protein